MKDEGFIRTDWRRHGAAAFLRLKQWWSFEGYDPEQRVHFVFLAMQAFPSHFVSLTAVDLESGRRLVAENMTRVSAKPGSSMEVSSQGKWGGLAFSGCAEEGWLIKAESGDIKAEIFQRTRSGMHGNRLLTSRIDYSLLQSVCNSMEGNILLNGKQIPMGGYGYCEHAWGVQPRLSAANWLHFWSPEASGVVMDCRYDTGVPHNYTFIRTGSGSHYLYAPAVFSFDPQTPDAPWNISSPDLALEASPLHTHRMVRKIPPLLPYISIDYWEFLLAVKGTAVIGGTEVPIDGIGKYDFNFNKW